MEIVYSSSSHHAMLFAYIARETIETFGTRGKAAVIQAVHTYGVQRGRRMAMRAKLDGVQVDGMSYDLYGEWECFPGQVECSASVENGNYQLKYTRCPWCTEWKRYGMLEYGKCYCGHVDAAIIEGLGIKGGRLEGSRVDGCYSCNLVFDDRRYSQADCQRQEARRENMAQRAKMPWQYHVGHLYQALRDVILEQFGREGRRILRRAMKNYEIHFGTQAKDLVLEYADLDFDELPPYEVDPRKEEGGCKIGRIVKTDVLVAGGSGAAVMAAVEASQKGLDVTLLSKGKVGKSGNLIMAGGGFGIDGHSARHELGIEQADDSFDQDDMVDCLIKEGFFLSDQDMAQLYVQEGPAATRIYLQWADNCGQKYVFMPNGTWIASGRSFAKALEQGLKENPQIHRLEDCTLVDLLRDEKRVTGALALDIYRGEMILIQAKTVILATGGYMPFDVNNTSSDMTGDGQAIAYRAGAELVDMEFILGMPTALQPAEMRGSIYPFVFEFNLPKLRYRLLDRNMQPITIADEEIRRFRGKKISKLVNSYYFSQAKAQGRLTDRGGLYLDYSENTLEEKKACLEAFYQRFCAWHPYGYYNGESLMGVEEAIMNDIPLEVTLGFEYSLGGIQVDRDMHTSVPGLFAAGEVTSGTFGACRAGDGILEMLVQGRKAGITAGEFCIRRKHAPIDWEQVNALLKHHSRYFRQRTGMSPNLLFRQIQRTCTEGFGLLRNEAGLRQTMEKLVQLNLQLQNLCCVSDRATAYNMEWVKAIQCENLLICCKAGVLAALERKESRGCHMRSDYPKVDHDNYLIKYVFHREKDAMVMSSRQPRTEGVKLPEGTRDSIMAYLTDPELDYRR